MKGTYKIDVQCYHSCSYSLVANQEDSYIYLIDGLPLYYGLTKNNRVYFKATEISSSALSCTVRPKTKKFHPLIYVDQGMSDLPFPGPNSIYAFSKYNEIDNTMYFSVPFEGKQLKIGVANEGEDEGYFEIQCSSGTGTGIKVLVLGETSFDEIVDDDSIRKFELNLDEEGYLEIHLVPCISNFKLEVSTHWNIVSEDNVQLSVSRLSDGMLRAVIPNTQSTIYYVTVGLAENQQFHYTPHQFEITAQLYNFKEIDQKRLVPGNQGIIYSKIESTNVYLEWTAVEFDDESRYEGEVEYKIYMTDKEPAYFLTSCSVLSLEINNEAKLVKSVKNKSSVSFQSPFENKTTVNVLAVIHNYYNRTLVLPYLPIKANHTEMKTFQIYVFLVITVTTIIGITAAVFFFIKYRRSQRLLQIEMTDVRDYAHSSTYLEDHGQKITEKSPFNPEDSN